MWVFDYDIQVGEKKIDSLSEITIESSWQTIADTCRIRMAGLKKKLEANWSVGDKVVVKLGYKPNLQTEFEGYVKAIRPGSVFELECEDEAWKLRRDNVTKNWKGGTTLKEVVSFLIPGVDTSEVVDVDFKQFPIKDVSRYKALEKLKDEYGLTVYFRGSKPVVGLAYTEKEIQGKEVEYTLYGQDCNAQADDLEFVEKEDVKLQVKAISILPDNTKVTAEAGDDDGDRITMHFYGIKDKKALQKIAEEEAGKKRYSGYRGSLMAFGDPYVQHGYASKLIDPKYPEREGKYLIDQVVTKVSKSGGFKRDVYLGRKAN